MDGERCSQRRCRLALLAICWVLCAMLPAQAFGQNAQRNPDSGSVFTISVGYSLRQPVADLKARFGTHNTLGAGVSAFFTNRLSAAIEFNYLFGNIINQKGILDSVAASNGFLINGQGLYQPLTHYMRGIMPIFKVGYLILPLKNSSSSGFSFDAGFGYLRHRIHYYYTGDAPPQLAGELVKGYDRLTHGPLLAEGVTFRYLSPHKAVNFSIGLEAMQGFTRSLRSWDYDTNTADTHSRLDASFGIKATWHLPFYKQSKGPTYFY